MNEKRKKTYRTLMIDPETHTRLGELSGKMSKAEYIRMLVQQALVNPPDFSSYSDRNVVLSMMEVEARIDGLNEVIQQLVDSVKTIFRNERTNEAIMDITSAKLSLLMETLTDRLPGFDRDVDMITEKAPELMKSKREEARRHSSNP